MASFRKYDRSTGQMFHQWDVPVPGAIPKPWYRVKTPLRRPLSVPYSHRRGPTPLVDICLRAVVQHIEEIDEIHLRYLPSRLTGRLWEYVKHTGMLSVATWKLLIRIAQDEETAHYVCPLLMRHGTWANKTQPLAAYIEPLVSDTFDFMTHLTITGMVRCEPPELLQLTRLKNLAVLEIIQPPDDERGTWTSLRLTDSIVREWSRSPNPFPFLRVLRVWGDDHTTIQSLRYISAFPSLAFYDVAGRKRDWIEKGGQSVWKSRSKTWKTDLNDTLSTHFCLLPTGIPEGEWTSEFQSTEYFYVVNLIREIQKDSTELTPFQRDLQEAYKEICMDSHDLSFPSLPLALQCMCSPSPEPSKWLGHNSLWGFLMYCQIGKVLSDRDLLAQGLEIGERRFALDNIAFPPRPILNLVIGEGPCNPGNQGYRPSRNSCEHVHTFGRMPLHRGGFETQITFVRDDRYPEEQDASNSSTVGGETAKRSPDASTATRRPHKRRQGVSDILQSFGSG
ncbi:hypothetical protein F5Y10DRAFT_131965 [Nemania abortiva]|nr:hypothetical protein F5Y10DRAFT_131965 [Nemania abortiva]